MKPSGFWKDVGNVKREIEAFNLERGSPGVMPKENELKSNGRGSLANAIHQHGGFKRFASEHGYLTRRKPNGYYKQFEALESELLRWVEESGTPRLMPTAQQLKDACPPRHDLVKAISDHGGFLGVAKRLGLSMTHTKKPDGYYDDPVNLAREIYAAVAQNKLSGVMPTPTQLVAMGKSGLVAAICARGGFWSVAESLGLTPNRRQKGYWTAETVDAEVKAYVERGQVGQWMPTDFELRETGRADLAVAIARYGGGMREVAARLGLVTRAPRRNRRWADEGVIARELLEFIREHGAPGRMPTQASLIVAGRCDLAIAISRFGGGWTRVAGQLGLELAQMPKDHWNDIANVKAAILAFNERRGRTGEMPTKTDLDLAGEFGLGSAIEKLGGYPAVAAMFGLSSARITLWPRSREELVLAHELASFTTVDLDDHKIVADGKSRDADIIIRQSKIVIEYDSYHWHKDNAESDAVKTQALVEEGWRVIRVREEPLGLIQPGDILIRKGQLKEACNRVLLRLVDMATVEPHSVNQYIAQRELRNIAACERHIAEILPHEKGASPRRVMMRTVACQVQYSRGSGTRFLARRGVGTGDTSMMFSFVYQSTAALQPKPPFTLVRASNAVYGDCRFQARGSDHVSGVPT